MQIIPSLDILAGRCIRLTEGDYSRQTTYPDLPREIAARYRESGAASLHLVDLEGAKAKRIIHWEEIGAIAAISGLELQVGGGIRTEAELERLFDLGVSRAVIGSLAIQEPELLASWVRRWGPSRFCIALDLRDGLIATHGWLETAKLGVDDVLPRLLELGVQRVLCTDIARDGKLAGPNLGLYASLVAQYPKAQWIASGGVSGMEDLQSLASSGVYGVVIGKALLEGKISLKDVYGRLQKC